jgi:RNA polymerase sigma-70 factor (ECF subfamily)
MNTRQESLKDEILVLRTQQGSREAFEELVQRWQKRLWFRVLRITRDEAASWDIVQETWQRVIRSLPQLDDPAAFPGWLLRITQNLAIDWIRQDMRRRDAHASYAQSAQHTDAQPKSGFEGLRAALAQLSSADSEILTLFYLDELSLNDIADMLGIPVGTAKSRLHYARARLRAILEEQS